MLPGLHPARQCFCGRTLSVPFRSQTVLVIWCVFYDLPILDLRPLLEFSFQRISKKTAREVMVDPTSLESPWWNSFSNVDSASKDNYFDFLDWLEVDYLSENNPLLYQPLEEGGEQALNKELLTSSLVSSAMNLQDCHLSRSATGLKHSPELRLEGSYRFRPCLLVCGRFSRLRCRWCHGGLHFRRSANSLSQSEDWER